MDTNDNNTSSSASFKAKIMAHPHYHRLLATYINCQKVETARLEEACGSAATMGPSGTSCLGEDPALDQFMEEYCKMLTKYEQELSKPFKEPMLFLQGVESQFKGLTVFSPHSGVPKRLSNAGDIEELRSSKHETENFPNILDKNDVASSRDHIFPPKYPPPRKVSAIRDFPPFCGRNAPPLVHKRNQDKFGAYSKNEMKMIRPNSLKQSTKSRRKKIQDLESCGSHDPVINSKKPEVEVEERPIQTTVAKHSPRSPHFPAEKEIWKGGFKFLDTATMPGEFYGGFKGQPPSIVSRKVYEFLSGMPIILQVVLLPRDHVWPYLFQNDHPELHDIDLYFFPSATIERSKETYANLFQRLEAENSVMMSSHGDVELLIFTSKQLHVDSQDVVERSIREQFLWAICRNSTDKIPLQIPQDKPLRVYRRFTHGRNINN